MRVDAIFMHCVLSCTGCIGLLQFWIVEVLKYGRWRLWVLFGKSLGEDFGA